MKKLLSSLKVPFIYIRTEFFTIINSITYNRMCRLATRRYKKGLKKGKVLHRHVVPVTKQRLGVITHLELNVYNKHATKKGLKKIRYKKLKKEAYFTTDTLQLKPHREKLALSCVTE